MYGAFPFHKSQHTPAGPNDKARLNTGVQIPTREIQNHDGAESWGTEGLVEGRTQHRGFTAEYKARAVLSANSR